MATHVTRNDSPVVVVCALDDNYAMSLAAMLKSLEHNLSSETRVHVYLLESNVSKSHKRRIEAALDCNHLDLTWMPVDDSRVKDLRTDHHISTATYYRLLLEERLTHLEKAIYIDCDMIVNEDLGKLWNEPFNGAHLLAVPQLSPDASMAGSKRGLRTYEELGIDPNTRLFNAGVLLMNLPLWREDRISERVITYLRKYEEKVLWWDQDGRNAILPGKWHALDYRWNVMTSLFRYYDSWRETPFNRTHYYEIITHPYIVHYNSTLKPWHSTYNLPFKDLFFRYLDRTSWQGWRP